MDSILDEHGQKIADCEKESLFFTRRLTVRDLNGNPVVTINKSQPYLATPLAITIHRSGVVPQTIIYLLAAFQHEAYQDRYRYRHRNR